MFRVFVIKEMHEMVTLTKEKVYNGVCALKRRWKEPLGVKILNKYKSSKKRKTKLVKTS